MPRHPAPRTPARAAQRALTEREMRELEELLARVPEPLDALDVSMLDGYLCALLVQPQAPPAARWLAHVTDFDGRPLPPGFDPVRLHELVCRRHAELDRAIQARQWFDPWVFELESGAAPSAAVYPWVAGFAAALELFPALLRLDERQLTEPLALLYRHLDPDDLEDADELLAEIETLEPPADLAEAVEDLVRATLLLADISRPLPPAPRRRG